MMENTEFIVMFVIKYVFEDLKKKHLKSQTHINNIRKIEQLDKSFQVISLI